MTYSAKQDYQHKDAPSTYEKRSYYKGRLGAYRKRREFEAIRQSIQLFEKQSTILDAPCGNGRWFEQLSRSASKIIGMDISGSMADFAAQRTIQDTEIEVIRGDAEQIPLDDKAVDHVFSYALMKHLPNAAKANALREFMRVSRNRIAVSFAVAIPAVKTARELKQRFEKKDDPGYLLTQSELELLVESVGLHIVATYKVGLPVVGMETLVVLERL